MTKVLSEQLEVGLLFPEVKMTMGEEGLGHGHWATAPVPGPP